MIVRECLEQWLRRYGEPFWIGVQTAYGFFMQPPAGLLRWLFSSEALAELARPLWALLATPDVAVFPQTTLSWRNARYRVLYTLEFYVGTTMLYRLAIIEAIQV